MQQICDYSCPLGLMICVDPVLLKECKHMFCSACMMDLLDYHNQTYKCPLCRRPYINNEPLVVNFDLAKKIEQTNPQLYAERKEQIKMQQLLLPNQIKVNVLYGNTYKQIKSNSKNTNEWTMFVRLDYTKDTDRAALKDFVINEMIESVTYYLHETFHPNVLTETKSPFMMKRLGWGVFNIPILIKFKNYYNLPNLEVDHYLCFVGEGMTQSQITKLHIYKVQQFKQLQKQIQQQQGQQQQQQQQQQQKGQQ